MNGVYYLYALKKRKDKERRNGGEKERRKERSRRAHQPKPPRIMHVLFYFILSFSLPSSVQSMHGTVLGQGLAYRMTHFRYGVLDPKSERAKGKGKKGERIEGKEDTAGGIILLPPGLGMVNCSYLAQFRYFR